MWLLLGVAGLRPVVAADLVETGLPPAAPSGLRLTAAGPDVMLLWTDNSADDLGFLVERTTGEEPWAEIAAPTPNLNSCPDILEANGTYHYRVRAFNNYGTSDYSNVVSYVLNRDHPPDYRYRPAAPSQVRNEGWGAEVKLRWRDNSDNELGFAVDKMAPGGFWSQLGVAPADSTAYTDCLAAPGTYYYRVIAFNNFGPSVGSNLVTIYNPGQPQPIIGTTVAMQVGNSLMAVNGQYLEIDPGRGTAPVIVENQVLLPVRAVVQCLGGTVQWEAASRKVTIQDGDQVIELWIDRELISVNGNKIEIDGAPRIVNDRILVPVDFLPATMGAAVEWNEAGQVITIRR